MTDQELMDELFETVHFTGDVKSWHDMIEETEESDDEPEFRAAGGPGSGPQKGDGSSKIPGTKYTKNQLLDSAEKAGLSLYGPRNEDFEEGGSGLIFDREETTVELINIDSLEPEDTSPDDTEGGVTSSLADDFEYQFFPSTDEGRDVSTESIRGLTPDADGKIYLYTANYGVRIIDTKNSSKEIRTLGGPGSGNFGHEGRPGEVGGSGSMPGGVSKERVRVDHAMNKATVKLGLGNPKWPSKATYGQRGAMKSHVVKTLAPKVLPNIDPSTVTKADIYSTKPITDPKEASEQLVQDHLDAWAGSSNDLLQQTAIRDEFGVDDARMDRLYDKPFTPAQLANSRAYARQEYENTQRFLKENKIDYVSVYRGQGNSAFPGHYDGTATIMMQPASSWTTSLNVAAKFGSGKMILAARVPASRVLSTAVTGRGCLNESEVLIFGGKMTVHAVSRSIGDWKKRIVGVQRVARKPRVRKEKSVLTAIPSVV
jgi:hypothetical protein